MPESSDPDIDLRASGIVVTENIESRLIANVQQHLANKDVLQRRIRQIQLSWNEDCEAVMTYFDTIIKPFIPTLRGRPCFNRWFVQFHDRPKGPQIYKPGVEKGTYNVLIVIQPGPGLPLFCEGSHVEIVNGAMAPVTSIVEVPQREGAVVLFDATIGRQDTAVEGVGASCIILVY
ncbi:hypothetical protein BBP40_004027 [Aspergillus hancockii]|nr:hypothetical protein BBP40_004027 [Aspergillus hancockii]